MASMSNPAEGGVVINYGGGDQTLAKVCRGIYISTAGNLKVDMPGGGTPVTLTFTGLTAGTVYPIRVKKIYQVGSTAAGIALY